MNHRHVAWLTAIVYFIQGALGISAVALPIYFRSLGWSIEQITTIASLASLPWIFKIVYGYFSDSFPLFGVRRKSYLLVYLFCSIAGWVALAVWGKQPSAVLVSLWIANLGFAGTDVITDGLIVEKSDREWSRLYQSLAWGFRSLGAVATGMLGGWLMSHVEPQTIFLITACLPLLALPPLLLVREQPLQAGPRSFGGINTAKEILRFCLRKETLGWFVFLSLSTSSALFGTPFFFHMKEKLYFANDFLGFLISLGWAGAALGSLAFGFWMTKIPVKQMLYVVVAVNVLNILSTYAVRGPDSAAWLILFGGIAMGIVLIPLMSVAAEMTRGSGAEGSIFALMMGFFNLSQIVWGFLGGKFFSVIGVTGLILISALIQASAFFLIGPFLRKQNQTQHSVVG